MNKLRQILEFIMSLLGFLLNLKKKNPDEEERKKGGKAELLPPGKQVEQLPPDKQAEVLPPGKQAELLPPGKQAEVLPPGEQVELLPPGKQADLPEVGQEMFPAIVQPGLPCLVPDGGGTVSLVGGPLGGGRGMLGSAADTLRARGYGERRGGRRKQKQQLPVVAGWGLLMYAAVSCFC